jgi:hypothetical protein
MNSYNKNYHGRDAVSAGPTELSTLPEEKYSIMTTPQSDELFHDMNVIIFAFVTL